MGIIKRVLLNCGFCGRFVGNSCAGCCPAAMDRFLQINGTSIHKPVCRAHFGLAINDPKRVAS